MKTNFWEGLVLQPTAANSQILLKEYKYKDVIVPIRFDTNGQDSPRWTWILGFPPFKPLYAPAYVVHDWLLTEGTGVIIWKNVDKANQYWKELMIATDDCLRVRMAVGCMYAYWWYRKLKHNLSKCMV